MIWSFGLWRRLEKTKKFKWGFNSVKGGDNTATGKEIAEAGFKYLGTPYSVMDCQAFVEKCLANYGIHKNLAGSNAWYRYLMKNGWVGTPERVGENL